MPITRISNVRTRTWWITRVTCASSLWNEWWKWKVKWFGTMRSWGIWKRETKAKTKSKMEASLRTTSLLAVLYGYPSTRIRSRSAPCTYAKRTKRSHPTWGRCRKSSVECSPCATMWAPSTSTSRRRRTCTATATSNWRSTKTRERCWTRRPLTSNCR